MRIALLIAALGVAVAPGNAAGARATDDYPVPFRIGVAYCQYYDDGIVDETDPQGRNVTAIKCYQRPKGRSMTAFISTQLGGRVTVRRYRGIVRLAKPASQYKAVSTFNMGDYHCRRYSNGVTCAIPGHVFFVTSTAVSGH